MAPLTVPRSRRKIIVQIVLGAVGSAVCLGITVLLLQAVMRGVTSPMTFIGLIFMTLATVVTALSVVGLLWLSRFPGLVIEDRGFTDHTSMVSIGFIPWEQALGFMPGEYQAGRARNSLVAVVFADPQWPWTQLHGLRLYLNRLNQWFVKMPAGIVSADTLSIGNVELAALLVEQRRLRRPDLPEAAGPVPGAQPDTWEVADPNGYLERLGPQAAPPA